MSGRVLPPIGRLNRRERRRVKRLAKRSLRGAREEHRVRRRPGRPERVRGAMREAFEAWSSRVPWRLLPMRLRVWSLERFGQRFVSEFVTARLRTDG